MFILNCAILLCNIYTLGLTGKKVEIIEEKIADMSMVEERIKHLCEDLDSAFCNFR